MLCGVTATVGSNPTATARDFPGTAMKCSAGEIVFGVVHDICMTTGDYADLRRRREYAVLAA